MKTIPESFTHEGRRFELERRSEHAAIYRKIRPQTGAVIACEVHRIRLRPARPGCGNAAGTLLEESEQLASNAEFGRWAWSFGGKDMLERAIERFDELNRKAVANAEEVPAEDDRAPVISGHGSKQEEPSAHEIGHMSPSSGMPNAAEM